MSSFLNSSLNIDVTNISGMEVSTQIMETTNATSILDDTLNFTTDRSSETTNIQLMTKENFNFGTSASASKSPNYESNASVDYSVLLQNENSFEATALIPVTVYVIILMIIGVFGNLMVLYVYKFRFNRSTSRVFILSLAMFDLVTCLLGLPFHILDLTYPLTFVWDEVCKTLSFSLMFTILASIFVLDLIAIDRYRKICKPFRKQLSASGTKIICWVTVLVAAILAFPIIVIYGSADVDTRIPNVTGKECYISNDLIDTDIPMIYDCLTILIFVFSVFILAGLYMKVGILLWKRRKFNDSSRNLSNRSNSGTSTPDTSVIHLNTITDDVKLGSSSSVHFIKGNKDNVVTLISNSKSAVCKTNSTSTHNSTKERDLHQKRLKRMMSELSSVSGDESTSERGSGNSKFTSKRQMRTMRITSMLFIITLIFVISFLPYLIISIMNGLDENFWNDMTIEELVIFNLLLRTYFINNTVNPIVYWFLDKKFKQEVNRLFRDIRKCKWSKTFRLDHKSYTS